MKVCYLLSVLKHKKYMDFLKRIHSIGFDDLKKSKMHLDMNNNDTYDPTNSFKNGLPNLGQSCFVNAIFQALTHAEPISKFLDNLINNMNFTATEDNHQLTVSLCNIYKRLRNNASKESIYDDYFSFIIQCKKLKMFGKSNKHLPGFEIQEDASEFLNCLLNKVNDENLVNVSGFSFSHLYTFTKNTKMSCPNNCPQDPINNQEESTIILNIPNLQNEIVVLDKCFQLYSAEVRSLFYFQIRRNFGKTTLI
jgi:uncharacterized UBP type Zn finger protein